MYEIALLIAIYLAWSVGVHTAGSTLGIAIGSGILSLRKAVSIVVVFTVLGALFLSPRIVRTIGHDLVSLDPIGMLVVLLSAGFLITIFAFKGVPIFTTYLVMGALLGYSLVSNLGINLVLYGEILISLFSSPLIAFCFGFLIYSGFERFRIQNIKGAGAREKFESKFWLPCVVGLALLSLMIGANSVGVVMGVLGSGFTFTLLGVLGSIGVVIGITTWSYRIARTVGINITDLSPSRGFSTLIAVGLVILFFLIVRIPVSTTQTLIGATIGVGLARGKVRREIARTIGFSWAIGLPASILLGGLLGWLMCCA